VIAPVADQTELRHELLRKEIDRYEVVSRLVYRYVCTLNEGELANKYINEIALYDEDGDLIAIKSFLDKGKDEDQEMGFEIDDTF
ncbi:phage tail protein, partial [Vibrio vulnificus]|uniref:phage tail-collar fiber domain-containing protein n=2 Tax=Bacteria TaxID=2 RepID=UPI0039B639CA